MSQKEKEIFDATVSLERSIRQLRQRVDERFAQFEAKDQFDRQASPL